MDKLFEIMDEYNSVMGTYQAVDDQVLLIANKITSLENERSMMTGNLFERACRALAKADIGATNAETRQTRFKAIDEELNKLSVLSEGSKSRKSEMENMLDSIEQNYFRNLILWPGDEISFMNHYQIRICTVEMTSNDKGVNVFYSADGTEKITGNYDAHSLITKGVIALIHNRKIDVVIENSRYLSHGNYGLPVRVD